MNEDRTDAELLERLRDGDNAAFAALWERHSTAARRYARHLAPGQVDDLVAESFLAIYHQVTTTSKGPAFAFRSYLRAVIRNTAIRWGKDAGRFVDQDEVDEIEPRDGLARAEQASESVEVLAAFQELPDRWQRVLWLTEVADVPRPEIARELGIKPNAVSALHRRARSGLKLQWLTRQVPEVLRVDETHVARLLPQHLTEPKNAALAAGVAVHVAACVLCNDLLQDMRTTSRRVQTRTLAVLLGAGGVGGSATAVTVTTGTTAVATGLFGTGLAGLLTAGGLSVAAIGGSLLLTTVIGVTAASPQTAPPVASVVTAPPAAPTASAASPAAEAVGPSAPARPDVPEPTEAPTGRHVDDPTIPTVTLADASGADAPTAPTRPTPADPSVPSPSTDGGSTLSPGMATPTVSSGYLAPVLAGRTSATAGVAVEVDGQRFTPTVAPDGRWTFDARALQLNPGVHSSRVWAFDADTRSAAVSGTITILPLVVTGFEQLTGFEDMTVAEAQTTGIVIELTGPAGGRVYVSTMEGHTAIVPLGATGHTRLRLLMNSRGWYYFTFRALDSDGFWGPGLEAAADVYDPDIVFDPYGPDPDDMTFTLTAP